MSRPALILLALVLAACPWPASPPAPPLPGACITACEGALARCDDDSGCPSISSPECTARPEICSACHRPCADAFATCAALCTIPDLTSVRGG